MNPVHFLIPALTLTVLLLIRAEIQKRRGQIYVLKPVSTLFVIALALCSYLQEEHREAHGLGILIGLTLSFGGDMALMFQENRRAFVVGLGLFLLAHAAYAATFAWLSSWSFLSALAAALLAGAAVILYLVMRRSLGTMRGPVIVYIIVISVMVLTAVSTLQSPLLIGAQGAVIVVGAVLFYISDIILAANRFWKPWEYNRISLAFYYAGQACIALTTGSALFR